MAALLPSEEDMIASMMFRDTAYGGESGANNPYTGDNQMSPQRGRKSSVHEMRPPIVGHQSPQRTNRRSSFVDPASNDDRQRVVTQTRQTSLKHIVSDYSASSGHSADSQPKPLSLLQTATPLLHAPAHDSPKKERNTMANLPATNGQSGRGRSFLRAPSFKSNDESTVQTAESTRSGSPRRQGMRLSMVRSSSPQRPKKMKNFNLNAPMTGHTVPLTSDDKAFEEVDFSEPFEPEGENKAPTEPTSLLDSHQTTQEGSPRERRSHEKEHTSPSSSHDNQIARRMGTPALSTQRTSSPRRSERHSRGASPQRRGKSSSDHRSRKPSSPRKEESGRGRRGGKERNSSPRRHRSRSARRYRSPSATRRRDHSQSDRRRHNGPSEYSRMKKSSSSRSLTSSSSRSSNNHGMSNTREQPRNCPPSPMRMSKQRSSYSSRNLSSSEHVPSYDRRGSAHRANPNTMHNSSSPRRSMMSQSRHQSRRSSCHRPDSSDHEPENSIQNRPSLGDAASLVQSIFSSPRRPSHQMQQPTPNSNHGGRRSSSHVPSRADAPSLIQSLFSSSRRGSHQLNSSGRPSFSRGSSQPSLSSRRSSHKSSRRHSVSRGLSGSFGR